jgi:hypothetical protein
MRIGTTNPPISAGNYFGSGSRSCLFCQELTSSVNEHWHCANGVDINHRLPTLCFNWTFQNRNSTIMSMADSIRYCLDTGKGPYGAPLHASEIDYYSSRSGQEQLSELEAVDAKFVKAYNGLNLDKSSRLREFNSSFNRFFMLTAHVTNIQLIRLPKV